MSYKEYYNLHKNKLIEKLSEKVTCECGVSVIKSSIYRHIESEKHKRRLNGEIKMLKKYKCDICSYETKNNHAYAGHLNTYKHKYLMTTIK